MRVQLDNPVAVGPTNSFGETPVVGDDGANASVRTAARRHPPAAERLQPRARRPRRRCSCPNLPAVNVGDHYHGRGRRRPRLQLRHLHARGDRGAGRRPRRRHARDDGGAGRERARGRDVQRREPRPERPAGEVRPARRAHRRQPRSRRTSSRSRRCRTTTVRRTTASSPRTRRWTRSSPRSRQPAARRTSTASIDPVNDQDGGEPGGNIRQVFLFRTDRGRLVRRPAGRRLDHGDDRRRRAAAAPSSPRARAASTRRTRPSTPAASRSPASSSCDGQHVFVIANHFNSKGGDDPLMGRFQPPQRAVGDAAPPAGADRARLRRADPRGRPERERRRRTAT